jgi:type II secretory pathway component PulF
MAQVILGGLLTSTLLNGFIAAMVLLMALGIFMPMWDMAKAVKT